MELTRINLSYRTLNVVYGTPNRAKSVPAFIVDTIICEYVDITIYKLVDKPNVILIKFADVEIICDSIAKSKDEVFNLQCSLAYPMIF